MLLPLRSHLDSSCPRKLGPVSPQQQHPLVAVGAPSTSGGPPPGEDWVQAATRGTSFGDSPPFIGVEASGYKQKSLSTATPNIQIRGRGPSGRELPSTTWKVEGKKCVRRLLGMEEKTGWGRQMPKSTSHTLEGERGQQPTEISQGKPLPLESTPQKKGGRKKEKPQQGEEKPGGEKKVGSSRGNTSWGRAAHG